MLNSHTKRWFSNAENKMTAAQKHGSQSFSCDFALNLTGLLLPSDMAGTYRLYSFGCHCRRWKNLVNLEASWHTMSCFDTAQWPDPARPQAYERSESTWSRQQCRWSTCWSQRLAVHVPVQNEQGSHARLHLAGPVSSSSNATLVMARKPFGIGQASPKHEPTMRPTSPPAVSETPLYQPTLRDPIPPRLRLVCSTVTALFPVFSYFTYFWTEIRTGTQCIKDLVSEHWRH